MRARRKLLQGLMYMHALVTASDRAALCVQVGGPSNPG